MGIWCAASAVGGANVYNAIPSVPSGIKRQPDMMMMAGRCS